jgi:ribulose-phosphate 3-epimerase
MKNLKLGASILSVQSFFLYEKIYQLSKAGVNYFHIDIMDGNFVPNLSNPPSLYRDIYQSFPLLEYDLHFMVTEKALTKLIPVYLEYPPCYVTVHIEAITDVFSIARQVKEKGIKFGLAINPETDIHTIQEYLPSLDMVLLMSVSPGYGGQKFLEETYQKLQFLKIMREKSNLSFLIQVDGGINQTIAKRLILEGVNLLVIGNDLISDADPALYVQRFNQL